MAADDWSVIARFGDRISAQALVGLLESEHLTCRLASNEPLPGLGTDFAVLVPTQLQHRARWIRQHADVSVADLTYLAIGEQPADSE